MRPFTLLLAASLAGMLASACAAGDPIAPPTSGDGDGDGDGDGGGDGGRAGDGDGDGDGDGGTRPSTSSTSSTSGPSSSASSGGDGDGDGGSGAGGSPPASSSSGPMCEEDPCKLVAPQCGCAGDEMCTIDGDGDRVCVDEGTQSQGQECGTAPGDCEAGALCVFLDATEDVSSCARFCESDAQCEGQGGLCAFGLNGVPDVQLCSDNCDPTSDSGCAITGTKCSVYAQGDPFERYYTACSTNLGTGVLFDPCDPEVGCSTGFECLTAGDDNTYCFQWCKVGVDVCPDDLACLDFDPPIEIGATTYGVCSN